MGRERERQTGDDRDEPPDGRRAMTEMRVDVTNITRVEDESRDPNGLEKFFQVQLARRSEETPPRSHGLAESRTRSTSKSRRSLPGNSAKSRQEILEVQA